MAKSFTDIMEPGPTTRALVVDSLNLGFRWKHKGVFDFSEDYIRTIRSLAKSYDCGTVLIAADWGSSQYRKEIYPEYKGNREELRAKQTEKEAEDFLLFLEEYNRTLDELEEEGFPVFRYKGVEADDIAAWICKNKHSYGFEHLWLISSDRDWDLLIDEKVSRFSYINRKETTFDNWSDHYDISPAQYLTFKCLTGDKGDNIPGITGIGDKRAAQIIESYGDVFDIYDQCPIDSKYKYIQTLNSNADQLLTNVELMDLVTYCDEAIGDENISDMHNKLKDCVNV